MWCGAQTVWLLNVRICLRTTGLKEVGRISKDYFELRIMLSYSNTLVLKIWI